MCARRWCVWFGIVVLLWTSVIDGDAVQQPAVALFDSESRKVLSTTAWSDIDFGGHSIIGGGKRPARVLALQATLPVTGNSKRTGGDVKLEKDLFLIPYCFSSAQATGALRGGTAASCSLSRFEGYVLLRFRGGWEDNFAASLWQDSTPSIQVEIARHIFREVFNDSSVTFPLPRVDSSADISKSSGIVRRYELIGNCNDFTDECFQARYMTYTTSFKEIPLEMYTGRMIFHLGHLGAWNNPWTLRLQGTMPHESYTNVSVVFLLVDTRESFNWAMWLTATLSGQLFLVALCVATVVSFILSTKELGMRLSEPVALNERRTTVLYEENEQDDMCCRQLYQIMMAAKETCMKIATQLCVTQHAVCRYLNCRTRRRWGEVLSPVVTDGEMREKATTEEAHQRVELRNVSGAVDDCGEESGDDEHTCRICRCKKPVDELFSPCVCDGSAKYVHRSCLERWRATTSNAEHQRVCAECKTPYILILERVPVSTDEFFHSPVCVPACRILATRALGLLLFVFLLWGGGYYLKFCIYLFTGLDEGIVWSAANFYHWVLGLYSIVALCLNTWALEYILTDFVESWQQLLLLVMSLCTVEIPLNYVGQVVLSWLMNRFCSLEVSYGLGIIVTAMSSVTLLPHLYVFLQSLSAEREIVAPRSEEV
ncbi:hypothetical protein TraAM80_01759 [Trypanosoma rangeli]|uniref:RING-CH-type domain-containing protein n=1 Tax=Trypanosoma rangeli TaxID=5698 RepID=A0A3R7MRQ1_TRYRA|nr:uncharacterized protein TraAM80_01759 [Trypanosoma rangeli]RNF10181.1 hypothetical protein TraAM80_01759 [Trypanosoma rangeli]|eukprot:RNF10181.1 hypothetical protein TraAM80_01759 [Trypanosoma rangeli]